MRKTGPAPLALHLTLRWRDDVIALRRLAGRASVTVGALAPIPCAPGVAGIVARVSRGAASAVVPARGMVTVVRADGRVELVEGPADVPLAAGDAVDLRFGAFRFEALAGASEVLPGRAGPREARPLAGLGVAALAHAVIFGLAAHDARASSAEARADERAGELRGLLATAELRARAAEIRVEDAGGAGQGRAQDGHRGDGRQGGGASAAGAAGAMGDRLAQSGAQRRYAVSEVLKKDEAPSLSREEALTDAAVFGMIGLLAQGAATPTAASAEPWAHASDAVAARGDMWGQEIGEAFGAGGLGLSGIGEGGGGRGEGIGLGSIGALGHGAGGLGAGTGGEGSLQRVRTWRTWGGAWQNDYGRHHQAVYRPRCRCGTPGISGGLPADVVRRVVRQSVAAFDACYARGLRSDAKLAGTVNARFVIGRDGAVWYVGDGGSSLHDPAVVSCVLRTVHGLSFPASEGDTVRVTYPIECSLR
jgi:hypothetical protein